MSRARSVYLDPWNGLAVTRDGHVQLPSRGPCIMGCGRETTRGVLSGDERYAVRVCMLCMHRARARAAERMDG